MEDWADYIEGLGKRLVAWPTSKFIRKHHIGSFLCERGSTAKECEAHAVIMRNHSVVWDVDRYNDDCSLYDEKYLLYRVTIEDGPERSILPHVISLDCPVTGKPTLTHVFESPGKLKFGVFDSLKDIGIKAEDLHPWPTSGLYDE